MAELLDLVDEQNNPLGKTKLRSEVHRDGDWHRVAHIYIINRQGDFLVHLRSPLKDLSPNCWDTRFGGHVVAGMTVDETAVEELRQELGIKLHIEDLLRGPVTPNLKSAANREQCQVYFYKFDGPISDLHFSDNEVVEVKWMTPEEIKKSMQEMPERWAPLLRYFEEVLVFYKNLK